MEFIPDGFTLDGKTDGVPGFIFARKFKYRPAGIEAKAALGYAYGDAKAYKDALCKLIAEHTGQWQIVGDDGTLTARPYKAADFARFTGKDADQALAFIMGNVGPALEDEVPKSPGE